MNTNTNLTPKVVIIGGGFAGLIAATELKRNDIPFILYEGSKQVGGLAQTFTDENGFKYDFGTHLITNRLAKSLGIESQCMEVGHFGESIFLNGNIYSYPFGLFKNHRFLLSAIASKLRGPFRKKELNLKDKFRNELGYKLADDVAIPLAESLMGAKASNLSVRVSNKLPGILQTIYLKVAGKLSNKAVAIGYSMELPESRNVWHTYPKEGITTLCSKLVSEVEENIHLDTKIDKIFVENDKVTGVRANGEFIPASLVINTAPVNVLPLLLDGTNKLDHLKKFKYRAMVFVNIMLEGKKVLPNVALWTPEDKYPFFRINEPSHSMPWLAPEGKTLITADIGCSVGDEHWNRSDGDWKDYILPYLEQIIPDIREKYIGCKVLKTKYAYPTYLNQYEAERLKFIENSSIEGLCSIGRNGEFSHILMEDVYVRTKRKIGEFISKHKVTV